MEPEVQRFFKLSSLGAARGLPLTASDISHTRSPEWAPLIAGVFGTPLSGQELTKRADQLFGGSPGMSGWDRLTCKAPETRIFFLQGLSLAQETRFIGVEWLADGSKFIRHQLRAAHTNSANPERRQFTYAKSSSIDLTEESSPEYQEFAFDATRIE